jgi:hypothetical protein
MDVAKKLVAAMLLAVFAFGAVACDAKGSVDGGGASAEIEGDGDQGDD